MVQHQSCGMPSSGFGSSLSKGLSYTSWCTCSSACSGGFATAKGWPTQTRMTLSRPPLNKRLPELYRLSTLPLCPRSTLQPSFNVCQAVEGSMHGTKIMHTNI